MIVTRLYGGLGNQMFQYALGFGLALSKRQPLYYEASSFSEPANIEFTTPRSLELDCFQLVAKPWQAKDNRIFFPSESLLHKLLHQWKRRVGKNALLYEQKLGFDPTILPKAKQNSYAVGYWQSVKYFEDYRSQLLSEFQFRPTAENSLLQKIRGSNLAVALHVRRGDYATLPAANAQHGVLAMDYYEKAVTKMTALLGQSFQCFVFSDDLEWCLQNFSWLQNAVFCETKNEPLWYDMYLMTQCHHHIIANSSYSWWAAWLCNHSHQQVIAPLQWFRHTNSIDLQMHPVSWILI